MNYKKIDVSAHQDAQGRWMPQSFRWRNEHFHVQGSGRRWEDEAGLHILVMVSGNRVFELIYDQHEMSWSLKPPRKRTVI